jgi:hypothetical protein
MVTRKIAKGKKGASEAPPQETTVSEPVKPEETQEVLRGFWTN